MNDLTEREKDIFLFIENYYNKNGFSPSMREIQKGVFLSSPTQIHTYIYRLQKKGYINIRPRISRSITIKKHSFN